VSGSKVKIDNYHTNDAWIYAYWAIPYSTSISVYAYSKYYGWFSWPVQTASGDIAISCADDGKILIDVNQCPGVKSGNGALAAARCDYIRACLY
jgi:hypothetical protein